MWSDALAALEGKVSISTQDKGGVRAPKQVAALIDNREIFELQLGRQGDPGFTYGTVIIAGEHGPGVFTHDIRHTPITELADITYMLQCLVAAYPNLGRPYFGEKQYSTAKCAKCGTVIESRERHEFVSCHCGAISVDGGTNYCRRCGKSEDFAPMSKDDVVRYIPNIHITKENA
jgi:hypothetical protein